MANFNKVMLMGNLTRDPEIRYASGGGNAICKFGLATNRKWRDQSGQQQEETCFVDIVVFGRQAETCGEYLSKGRPVFIEGRLSFSTWQDRETGANRSKLEVVGERVQFLGSRGDTQGGGGGRGQESGGYRRGPPPPQRREAPAPASAPAPMQSESRPSSGGGGGGGSQGIDFDDIPF